MAQKVTSSTVKTMDGVRRSRPATPVAQPKPEAKPVAAAPQLAPLHSAEEVNSLDPVVRTIAQPSKKHWVRHVLLFLLLTALVLAAWLAYSSATHRVL